MAERRETINAVRVEMEIFIILMFVLFLSFCLECPCTSPAQKMGLEVNGDLCSCFSCAV